jgi:hypothetical protein
VAGPHLIPASFTTLGGKQPAPGFAKLPPHGMLPMATSKAATHQAIGTAPAPASRCPWKIAPSRHLRGDLDEPMPQIADVEHLVGRLDQRPHGVISTGQAFVLLH